MSERPHPVDVASWVARAAQDPVAHRQRQASADIEVLSALRGKRGDLSGWLEVGFAAAQEGPLVMGRTACKGGGLFAAAA